LFRNLVNIIGFYAGWFAAVLGAGKGIPWFGVIAVPFVLVIHLALSHNKKAEVILILIAGAIGFCVDSLLVFAGIFTPVRYLFPLPFSTPWMVLLWMNLATVLNVSLRKLHGRYLLSAFLGSIGGPSAYYSGAKLGATNSIPDLKGLLILSVTWAAAVPALFWIAARINGKYTVEKD
jgi:tetrahydromethanopterin S-methyltransferase subunit D